jgi:hypothetical protein
MRFLGFFSGVVALALAPLEETVPSQPEAATAKYRVNYRPSDADPWQFYAQSRDPARANTVAMEVRQSGYQAEVVNDATPVPQFYPDASATSASNYYPTSNWAADYNRYMVPGGNYGYGWYGGWNPWYRHRVYPSYAANTGRYWHNGYWRGGGWTGGWGQGNGWGDGWNNSHRNWNANHADRGAHAAHHERHAAAAHHGYAPNRMTTGHHQAGHHAAAWHGNHHASAHRGTGHFAGGARTAGRRGGAHSAGGHGRAGNHASAGRHAGGMHARHLDP